MNVFDASILERRYTHILQAVKLMYSGCWCGKFNVVITTFISLSVYFSSNFEEFSWKTSFHKVYRHAPYVLKELTSTEKPLSLAETVDVFHWNFLFVFLWEWFWNRIETLQILTDSVKSSQEYFVYLKLV